MKVGLVLALCFAGTALASVASAKTPDAEIATPAGIKITEQETGRIFADGRGMALYTFDRDVEPNKSACNGACASAWPPLLVSDAAAPPAGWTMVTREDGSKQWAFRGKPLYSFARDSKAGDATGEGVNGTWHVAVVPAVAPAMPASIRLQESLLGQVFADASGKTLYFPKRSKAKCDAACVRRWVPVPAAGLARPIGEWTLVRRPDGTRQWAYRGKPLYTYAGDFGPGQVNGEGGEQQWGAVVQQPEMRPKEIRLRETADGPMFIDSNGMTLYALERSGLAGSRRGNTQPGAAVCDAECLKTWSPLRPRAMTSPVGAWSVIKRPDGSLQWAYDNKAVYTYAKDTVPGDAHGDITELHVDDRAHSWRVLRPM